MALPDMPRGKNLPRSLKDRRTGMLPGPPFVFAASILLVSVAFATAARALPHALLVPAIVALLFALAALAALTGWCSRQDSRAAQVTYWDVAGALTFIGIGLSLLVEPEQMARLVNGVHGE